MDRIELHNKLCEALGTPHVYYLPPENLKLQYPCLIYKRTANDTKFANDSIYKTTKEYELIVIDTNPESTLADRLVEKFKMCRIERFYISNSLHHVALKLYY